jgi:hypothetical protein
MTEWGGKRENSGRKKTGREKKIFYITLAEDIYLRQKLLQVRETENEVFQKIEQPIMKMECGHQQCWGEGADSLPVEGENAWCVHCQKFEKIAKVIPN